MINRAKTYVTSLRLAQPALRIVGALRCKVFDWQHSVETCGSVPLGTLSILSDNTQHGIAYFGSHPKTVFGILADLDVDYSKYVFIDFGSGKGRALLVASEYPFKKVIGVEFAMELHEIALKNIRRYRSATQKCHDVESVHADAAEYELPRDLEVIYFFHPFRAEVLKRVFQNIRRSLEECSRDILIVYVNPELDRMVSSVRGVQRLKQTKYYNLYRMDALV